jgi:flagellar biosynthesis GTPase FlhF
VSEPPLGTPGEDDRSDAGQVRTYRGRTIEELIPRIREELGPDAIILREREGLTGGIGGFFAQRCVEIDAQAAPRLSVYDDDFDDFEDDSEDEDEFLPEVAEEAPLLPAPDPVAEEAPLPLTQPPVPAPEPPRRPSAPFLDEASFAARLEEATLAVEPPLPPVADAVPAAPPAPPAFIAFDELGDGDLKDESSAPEPPAPEQGAAPTLSHRLLDLAEVNYSEPEPEAHRNAPTSPALAPAAPPEPEPRQRPEPPPVDLAPDPTAPWMAFAAEPLQAVWPDAAPPAPAPPTTPERVSPTPELAPTPQPAQFPYSGTPGYQPWPYGPRRRGGILPAAERVLRAALEATHAANERREMELQARYMAPPQMPPSAAPSPGPAAPAAPAAVAAPPPARPGAPAAPAPTPAAPVPTPAAPAPTPAAPAAAPTPQTDPEADARARRRQEEHRREAQLEERLTASGLSPQRAAALVAGAISRRGPFSADSELADEVRSEIVAALPTAKPVPRRGAIAVVGAGGSGKTRSVAALAIAYADAGIPVSVASFGGPAREEELGELLHAEDVNIIPAMRTRATSRAVASAREESLVIIDTASATPGDGSTIDIIAEALRSFDLDAIYLAVPATLSLTAGLKLVSGFSAFDLAGIVATHVDETDDLGMIAELAMRSSIPLAYTHTGLDLQNAIASADAGDIATSLV